MNHIQKEKDLQTFKNVDFQNLQAPQPSSSHIDYNDKFASLERINQEELAIKLAEQDRLYEEKLNELKRKRKEKNVSLNSFSF